VWKAAPGPNRPREGVPAAMLATIPGVYVRRCYGESSNDGAFIARGCGHPGASPTCPRARRKAPPSPDLWGSGPTDETSSSTDRSGARPAQRRGVPRLERGAVASARRGMNTGQPGGGRAFPRRTRCAPGDRTGCGATGYDEVALHVAVQHATSRGRRPRSRGLVTRNSRGAHVGGLRLAVVCGSDRGSPSASPKRESRRCAGHGCSLPPRAVRGLISARSSTKAHHPTDDFSRGRKGR